MANLWKLSQAKFTALQRLWIVFAVIWVSIGFAVIVGQETRELGRFHVVLWAWLGIPIYIYVSSWFIFWYCKGKVAVQLFLVPFALAMLFGIGVLLNGDFETFSSFVVLSFGWAVLVVIGAWIAGPWTDL